jgi:hypothetical protein
MIVEPSHLPGKIGCPNNLNLKKINDENVFETIIYTLCIVANMGPKHELRLAFATRASMSRQSEPRGPLPIGALAGFAGGTMGGGLRTSCVASSADSSPVVDEVVSFGVSGTVPPSGVPDWSC